jgi:hypothetical protein
MKPKNTGTDRSRLWLINLGIADSTQDNTLFGFVMV